MKNTDAQYTNHESYSQTRTLTLNPKNKQRKPLTLNPIP